MFLQKWIPSPLHPFTKYSVCKAASWLAFSFQIFIKICTCFVIIISLLHLHNNLSFSLYFYLDTRNTNTYIVGKEKKYDNDCIIVNIIIIIISHTTNSSEWELSKTTSGSFLVHFHIYNTTTAKERKARPGRSVIIIMQWLFCFVLLFQSPVSLFSLGSC